MIKTSMLAVALVMASAATAQQAAAPTAPSTGTAPPRPGTSVTPMPAGIVAANGQTPEQAQLDVAQCQNVASQASGYVPGAATPPPAAKPAVGGRARGAAKGATAGAVVGAVQNDDYPNAPQGYKDNNVGDAAGAGAAAGAVAGGMNQRQDRRKAKAANQQAATAQQQKATAYQSNYAGCLNARGYTVTPPPQ
jgi:hypothetical protein